MKRANLFLCLTAVVVILGLNASAFGQASKKQPPPPPQPLKPLQFPAFQEKTLPNGLRIVVIEHHEQPSVSIRLVMKAGAVYDPADKPGVAQMTATLLDQGTAMRSAQEIAQAIDFVGGSLGAGSGWDATFASAAVTSDQIDLGMMLLTDIVLNPAFKEEEIERQRKQWLSGLQVQMNDPDYLASAAFNRLVFGQHPYAQPIGGTPESIRAITRDDLVRFHQTYYLPNASIIAVVGDVKPAEAFAKVEQHLGGWKKGEVKPLPEFKVAARTSPRLLVIDKPDAVQTQIRVGHVGIAHTDPDYFTANVFNTVLGGGSGGRLYQEIRGKRGLTYGVGSSLDERLQPGDFRISTFTKTESTTETVMAILDEVKWMQTELVPSADLEARKVYITGSFPLQIETPDGIASQVLDAMLHGHDKSYLESYRDRINRVTAEQVKAFASSRIHPDRFVIVLAGNASAFESELKQKFDSFMKIAFTDLDLLAPDLKKKKEVVATAPVSEADRAAAMGVLQQTIAALGGEAYLNLKSQITRGSGTLAPPGVPQEFTLDSVVSYEVLPEKSRLELNAAFGTVIQAFNGEVGWLNVMGQMQDQTQQMKQGRKFGGEVLRRITKPGYTARPLPDAAVGGKPAKVVAVSDAEGNTTTFFIDAETHLVLKTAYEVQGQKNEEVFADYKSVQGIQVPHRLTVYQNGSKFLELIVSEVEINPNIDESIFNKPAGE